MNRFCITFLLLLSSFLSQVFVPQPCNTLLLESFDLPPISKSFRGENLICPLVTNNCCSYEAQLLIYKKWQVAKERKHIADFYKEFTTAFQSIFEDFKKIETLAQKTKDATADIPSSNCNKLATAVIDFHASEFQKEVVEASKKAFAFLMGARKGFYCSLCDGDSQRFFNKDSEEIVMSEDFCSKMVEETLNFYLFKYAHFMKISRLYSEFLVKCDLHGNYHPTKFLKHQIKFFRNNEILMEINSCKKGLAGDDAVHLCASFCQRFNPVRYDKYLEGELDKLYSYAKSLEDLMKLNEEKLYRDTEVAKMSHGRKLSDDHSSSSAAPIKELDEEQSPVTEFNLENDASLVVPISYEFDQDSSIKHNFSTDESLVTMGLEKFYDLPTYHSKVNATGLDFYTLGSTSTIQKDAAVSVFKKISPTEQANNKAFEAIIKS